MNYSVRIWSKAYAPSPDTDSFSIQVDKRLWERVMREEHSGRQFLRIHCPVDFEKVWVAPIGQPVTTDYDVSESKEETRYDIYVPLWMLDSAHLGGEGEESTVDTMTEEFFPEATRIKLRVIDSAFYNADIKDELEKALSALGVIEQHTTLQIPISALDGYTVEVFVSETEPANVVLCHGEEVALEFDEPVDQIVPPRPPTPIPFLETEAMVPESEAPQGFRAFHGTGNIIGSSNANIPEWRRDLGPPKRR